MSIIAKILHKLATPLLTFFGISAVQGVLTKAIMVSIFILILPVVLNNLLYALLNEVMTWANTNISVNGGNSFFYTFTGFGGYIADLLKLPSCVSIILSAISLRFVLRLVRLM